MLKKQIEALTSKREHSRDSRKRLGLPVVALVGYTNAGKSTLLNLLTLLLKLDKGLFYMDDMRKIKENTVLGYDVKMTQFLKGTI